MFSWSNSAPPKPGSRSSSPSPSPSSSSSRGQYPAAAAAHRRQNLVAFNPSGRSTPVPPADVRQTDARARQRASHIQSLLNDETLGPSTRKVLNDDTTYDTAFLTKSGHTLIMRTYVAPHETGFAQLRLAGCRATHDWIDPASQTDIVGCPALADRARWESSGVLLGQAVRSVMQHLQLRPPTVLAMDPSLLRRQTPAVQAQLAATAAAYADAPETAAAPGRTGEAEPRRNSETFDIPLPAVPQQFEEIESMGADGLQQLISDEDAFERLVASLSIVQNMDEFQQDIAKGNVKLAKDSTNRYKEQHDTLSQEIQFLSVEFNQKVEEYQSLEEKYNQVASHSQHGSDDGTILAKMDEARQAEEDVSEEIAANFMDGEMDMQEFVKSFSKSRRLYHIRAAKMELVKNAQR